MLDRKTFGIGVLTVTAVVLFIAQFIPVPQTLANVSIKDRGYSMVTARRGAGGEVVYVTDNRTGIMAAIVWDQGNLVVRAVRPVQEAFGASAGPGR